MTQPAPDAAAFVEVVLFSSARPLDPGSISAAAGLSEAEVREALSGLEARYAPGSSGIVLRYAAGGYTLATNPACREAVERLREEARPAPLSGAAHEVLASVLYLGPLTRGDVAAARGVNSDAVVRSLIERGLVIESGADTERPGSPALLGLTEEFLLATGAASREDFPPLESLVRDEELARVRERIAGAPVPEEGAADPGEEA
ncbi:MAG: SMC-Scp complex subunit ScpB [Rubrobacter sp.]|nr:SMC-Scp complex subunit ScpB [Rubrobacter sp.]